MKCCPQGKSISWRILLPCSQSLASSRLEILVFVDADGAVASARGCTVSAALVVARALLIFLGRLGTTAVTFWKRGNVLKAP